MQSQPAVHCRYASRRFFRRLFRTGGLALIVSSCGRTRVRITVLRSPVSSAMNKGKRRHKMSGREMWYYVCRNLLLNVAAVVVMCVKGDWVSQG